MITVHRLQTLTPHIWLNAQWSMFCWQARYWGGWVILLILAADTWFNIWGKILVWLSGYDDFLTNLFCMIWYFCVIVNKEQRLVYQKKKKKGGKIPDKKQIKSPLLEWQWLIQSRICSKLIEVNQTLYKKRNCASTVLNFISWWQKGCNGIAW